MRYVELETVDCSIGEERLIYIQLTKHRNFQNEGSAIQHVTMASTARRVSDLTVGAKVSS